MKRHADWPERLVDYIESVRRTSYSTNFNCAVYAAGAVKAITGVNPVMQMIGDREIKSPRDIVEVLHEFDGVRGLAGKFFGTDELLPPLMARRGDIVLLDGTDGETLGVCMGDHVLVVTDDDGLNHHPLTSCKGCWRVG